MKVTYLLFAGLIISVSALSSHQYNRPSKLTSEEILREMERKFELRDAIERDPLSFKVQR